MKRVATVITTLAVAWLVGSAGAAVAQAIDASNVAAKIAAARTAADHQALAAYFTSEANAAAAGVKTHEAMLAAYQGAFKKSGQAHLVHCTNLIKAYRRQQEDYTALAAEQTSLAESSK